MVWNSLSNERNSTRVSTSLVMPSSAEKCRERVKEGKKLQKSTKNRGHDTEQNMQVRCEKLKKWREEHPDLRKVQKEHEKSVRKKKSKDELECSDETEVLPIINFDCDEVIASEQQQQDLEDLHAVIGSELEHDLVADFDLSLLDV